MDSEHKTFLVRYRYEGAEWGLQISARDFDDAKARLAFLPYANIDGELAMTLPTSTGPLAAALVACRNAIHWLCGRST